MATVSDLKKDFSHLIKTGALFHSYMLFGAESQAEKLSFANELANFLETKKWPPPHSSGGEAETPKRVLIDAQTIDAQADGGIEAVRTASNFLWRKPIVSARRTLIINNADRLTLPAQNAILKTAEEPPSHALIILLSKNPEALLPAVTSRFQKIYVHGNFQSNFNFQMTRNFLSATLSKRKEIIKELVESEKENGGVLEEFVTGLMAELQKEPVKNYLLLKRLMERWTLIGQFNVNKKLQLEAALL